MLCLLKTSPHSHLERLFFILRLWQEMLGDDPYEWRGESNT